MKARIEVFFKDQFKSKSDDDLKDKFNFSFLKKGFYFIVNSNNLDDLELLKNNAHQIFYDEISQDIYFSNDFLSYQISHKPGVTDNVSNSLKEGLSFFNINANVSSGVIYLVDHFNDDFFNYLKTHESNDLLQVVDKLDSNRFVNPLVKKVNVSRSSNVETIDFSCSEDQIFNMSNERCLALSLNEIKVIKNHYMQSFDKRLANSLPAWPTDVELEILAQTWSEHCKHKIFSSPIKMIDHGKEFSISSIFKDFIKKSTKDVQNKFKHDWLVSVFKDNAGIVRFDSNLDICFKVETHNSPSALDPYGGAITGILGVNRDIMGCGLGAKPIANTNVFCFPNLELENTCYELLPKNVMPPKRILQGVHKGVEDGGNKSGIPTINGAFYFHQSYSGKPLVYVGTVGVLPHEINGRPSSQKSAQVDDCIVMVGGRVGIDGIHGATFSSLELDESAPSSAVQIGDPITQKRVLDFLLAARDKGLYTCVTDNGAGGLSSSIGEMAEDTGGAEIYIDKVPLKYPGLAPYEIMISESQERMTFSVSPEKIDEFIELAISFNTEATIVGKFTNDGHLKVLDNEKVVCLLEMDFLHNGLPLPELTARWNGPKKFSTPYDNVFKRTSPNSIDEVLKSLLSHPNISSKEKLIRRYDHEVQGATHIKPFFSDQFTSPANSGVIDLHIHGGEKNNAITVACGMSPSTSVYNPYEMAIRSVDECVRNIISSSGDINKCAILDNFCWPDPIATKNNPEGEYKLAQLIKCAQGLYDVCLEYGLPLISGKDSMKNDYKGISKNNTPIEVSILPTLLVSGVATVNIKKTIPSYAFENVHIFQIGHLNKSFLGSIYENLFIHDEDQLVNSDFSKAYGIHKLVSKLIDNKLVKSIHDISEGGMLCALSEKLFFNQLGFDFNLDLSFSDLFSEGIAGYLVSVQDEKLDEFLSHTKNQSVLKLGVTNSTGMINLNNESISTSSLYKFWNNGPSYE